MKIAKGDKMARLGSNQFFAVKCDDKYFAGFKTDREFCLFSKEDLYYAKLFSSLLEAKAVYDLLKNDAELRYYHEFSIAVIIVDKTYDDAGDIIF